jgi:O-antigen ligase
VLAGAALGILAAANIAVPGSGLKLATLALAIVAVLIVGANWIFAKPERWIGLLFAGLILLPPIPAPFGDTGAHLAPLIALLGGMVGAARIREWRTYRGTLPLLLLIFTAIMLGSAGFALLYSGASVGAQSAVRGLLFAIAPFVFLYTVAGPREQRAETGLVKILFWLAVAAAAFACLDFYYQLPAPAGFGPQYVWLDSGVFRRAQGLFYDASALGNFCVFFLVVVLVALVRPSGAMPFHRLSLLVGGCLFTAALIFSYSRGSLVNLIVAAVALLLIQRMSLRRLLGPPVALVVTGALGWLAAPEFFNHYWIRIAGSFEFLWAAPNRVLSGRLDTWQQVADFIYRHPWQTIFGIGYKTLPYSAVAGIVADNTYLSLLVETGIVGLTVFLLLNASIIRTAFRAARSSDQRRAFYGSWIFCFWLGEMAQMLSGDLITYWRVLPVYLWVLGMAARENSP